MLNFAEQTGSGAVMIVWSFLLQTPSSQYMTTLQPSFHINKRHHTVQDDTASSYSSELTHINCIIYHSPPDQVNYKAYPKKWHDLVLLASREVVERRLLVVRLLLASSSKNNKNKYYY
jgi:hypothetical protein